MLASNLWRGLSLLGVFAYSPMTIAADGKELSHAPAELQDCSDCPRMIVVPPGQFTMGADDAAPSELEPYFDERPSRIVSIAKPLAISKFEITLGEFKRFVDETAHTPPNQCIVWVDGSPKLMQGKSWRDPNFPQSDSSPVVCVNWHDAIAYTQWLTSKSGQPYRLLTESEWEYVVRAGSSSVFPFGESVRDICAHANVTDVSAATQLGDKKAVGCANDPSNELNCKPGSTDVLDDKFSLRAGNLVVPWVMARCDDRYGLRSAPVGSYKANAFGLFDTIGNVWEWVADCYEPNYNGAPTDGSPVDMEKCPLRVLRGGAWAMNADGWRAADRDRDKPDTTYAVLGFRIARAMDGAAPVKPRE